jgi:hypothetical protein
MIKIDQAKEKLVKIQGIKAIRSQEKPDCGL